MNNNEDEGSIYGPHLTKCVNPTDCLHLDEAGFGFIKKCIEELESRGLEEEGLYRTCGVSSEVKDLVKKGLNRKAFQKSNISDPTKYSNKTIACAIKLYLHNLEEPLMTYEYYDDFISAAKCTTRKEVIDGLHSILYKIPTRNFDMLDILIHHLRNVDAKKDKNKMDSMNLGRVFGPTLLRKDTIDKSELTFGTLVIQFLIQDYQKLFKSAPGSNDVYRDKKSK